MFTKLCEYSYHIPYKMFWKNSWDKGDNKRQMDFSTLRFWIEWKLQCEEQKHKWDQSVEGRGWKIRVSSLFQEAVENQGAAGEIPRLKEQLEFRWKGAIAEQSY